MTSSGNPKTNYRILITSVALLIGTVSAIAAEKPYAEPPGTATKRIRYFEDKRAFPFDRIPAGARQAAVRDAESKWPDTDRAAAITNNTWKAIGPTQTLTGSPTSGRINTIAVDPTDPQVIYLGAATGGVWKTTNGGTTWKPLTDKQCSLAMGSIALDPVKPNIVYAGTGEENFSADSYYGCGVLRSTDGGATWKQLGGAVFDTTSGGATIAKLVVDPASAGSTTTTKLVAATSFGIYRSTNSGRTWSQVQPGAATDIVVNPSDSSILYAALGNVFGSPANGVYKSSNRGASWTQLGGGLPTIGVGRVSLGISNNGKIIFAAMQNSSTFGLLGIWKSIDSGKTWTPAAAAGASCSSQCWYDMYLQVDPTNSSTVYFGGVSLYKSTDGGASFPNIGSSIHPDQHAFAFHPTNKSIIFVGNDGGIYKSTNGGGSWSSLNTNVAITQFYPGLSLHPTSASTVLGGTQDNHTQLRTTSNAWSPVTFQGVGGCDGGFTVIDSGVPSTTYAECQWGGFYSGPRRSDSGGTYLQKNSGISFSDGALFIPPIVGSRISPQRIYFGTVKLYRTTNKGESWTPISGDLTGGGSRVGISAIAEAPSSGKYIYAGTSNGRVHVSTDGGTTFNLRTTGLPPRYISDFAVHPTQPKTAFVVVSGFFSGHIFKTTDAGANWNDVSGNLPDVPVNAVLLDPGAPTQHIFAGTDIGVFVTEDGGSTWKPFNSGLPKTVVSDLVFNPATGVLVAATHGRGSYQIKNPVMAPPQAAIATAIEDDTNNTGESAGVSNVTSPSGSPSTSK